MSSALLKERDNCLNKDRSSAYTSLSQPPPTHLVVKEMNEPNEVEEESEYEEEEEYEQESEYEEEVEESQPKTDTTNTHTQVSALQMSRPHNNPIPQHPHWTEPQEEEYEEEEYEAEEEYEESSEYEYES